MVNLSIKFRALEQGGHLAWYVVDRTRPQHPIWSSEHAQVWPQKTNQRETVKKPDLRPALRPGAGSGVVYRPLEMSGNCGTAGVGCARKPGRDGRRSRQQQARPSSACRFSCRVYSKCPNLSSWSLSLALRWIADPRIGKEVLEKEKKKEWLRDQTVRRVFAFANADPQHPIWAPENHQGSPPPINNNKKKEWLW